MKHTARRQWVKVGGPAFLLIILVTAIFLLTRPNPLRRAADSMVGALRNGDGQLLIRGTIEEERTCSNLTEDRLHQAWEILLKPYIASSKFVRVESAKQVSNDYQATGSIWFTDSAGNPWRMNFIANQSNGEAKGTVLFHMFATASLFDEKGHAATSLTSEHLLRGLRKYRAQLQGIGIERIMLNPGTCLAWQDLEQLLLNKIEARRRAEQAKEAAAN